MCRLHNEKSLAIARLRCECRQLVLMGLCCLLLISMKPLLCILLYAGIHPTPGRLLSLQDDLVVQLLYSMMARAIPLWGCSRLLWIQRGNGEWGSDTLA